MQYYILTRNGRFRPHKPTENQCGLEDCSEYDYELKLVFLGNIELDKDGFIIKHENINFLVTTTLLYGSCEEMHKMLFESVFRNFELKNINLIAYKATIAPILRGYDRKLVASLDYIWTKKFVYLPLLT